MKRKTARFLRSTEEIEKYAVEVLGMQRCTAEQIEYIDMSEQTG